MPSAATKPAKVKGVSETAGLFSSPEKRTVVISLLLVAATLTLYNPVSRHPFVNFDDDSYVTENPHVRAGLNWNTIAWAFRTTTASNWHPLTWISHELDYQLFGLNPAGHHYTSVLLHAANVVLLFLLLQSATGYTGRSLMVAALFALHPINVESVAWVAERKNVLSMFFFLLAMLAYGKYAHKPSAVRYVTVAILFALGLMAKPMVITLPFVLLLWDFWPLGRMSTGDRKLSGVNEVKELKLEPFSWLVLEKLPLLALSAASAIITMRVQSAGGAVRSIVESPFPLRLQNAILSYALYVGKVFWPSPLAPMYPHPENSLQTWQVAVSFLFMLGITALVIALRMRRYQVTGWLWFLGTLVPMIGLIQVGTLGMADRYAYLPALGLFVMACWDAAEWAQQRQACTRWLAASGAVTLMLLAFVTHRQLSYWSDNVTLWSHTLQVTSRNYVAEDNLGGALLALGRPEEAMQHFQAAVNIKQFDPVSNSNLAAYQQQRGNLRQAIEMYARVLRITTDAQLRATVFTNLGFAYRDLGDYSRARESYEAAIGARPENTRAMIGLGVLAQKTGDLAEAISQYSRTLAVQPTDVGYLLLAQALEQNGRSAEAQSARQEARRVSHDLQHAQLETEQLLAH